MPVMSATQHRPWRVLHVFASLARGGAETWLMDVVRNTSRDELAIDVCAITEAPGAYEEEFKSLGGSIYRCPLGKNPWHFARTFREIVTEGRYDIVHSHLYYFSGVVLRAAARGGVTKRVAHIHPVEDVKGDGLLRGLYARRMRRLLVQYGTDFVAPSRAGMAAFWGPDWQTHGNKSVIYNGVRVERFLRSVDRAAVRRELEVPEDASLVLNVGRFVPHKRHAVLVDAAAAVLAHRRNVYFLLIGAGPLKESVEERVTSSGLGDQFRFVTGRDCIDPFFFASDAFAFPSCNEGFGIVIAEAAAAGLPVIACDIPGVREAATACHDATLLAVDAVPRRWAEALVAALGRPRLSECRRRARLDSFPFTIEASIAALREVYNR